MSDPSGSPSAEPAQSDRAFDAAEIEFLNASIRVVQADLQETGLQIELNDAEIHLASVVYGEHGDQLDPAALEQVVEVARSDHDDAQQAKDDVRSAFADINDERDVLKERYAELKAEPEESRDPAAMQALAAEMNELATRADHANQEFGEQVPALEVSFALDTRDAEDVPGMHPDDGTSDTRIMDSVHLIHEDPGSPAESQMHDWPSNDGTPSGGE